MNSVHRRLSRAQTLVALNLPLQTAAWFLVITLGLLSARADAESARRCEICDKPISAGFLIREHFFCREDFALPKCSACDLPHKNGVRLADGRSLCRACLPHVVRDQDYPRAKELYNLALAELGSVTGLRVHELGPAPQMFLVNLNGLPSNGTSVSAPARNGRLVERGTYWRKETYDVDSDGTKRRSDDPAERRIYLLSNIHTNDFVVVAAHELAHDLLHQQYPSFTGAPLWAEEGICQYLGAMVARRVNATNEVQTILDMDDPVYGQGYRYFRIRFGDQDWPGLRRWIQQADLRKLEPAPPALFR